jgi:pimeloyl-ACP methyl ester carboxylesterase
VHTAQFVTPSGGLIPAARHLTFPTGHCVAQQDPELFASAVLDFAATRST